GGGRVGAAGGVAWVCARCDGGDDAVSRADHRDGRHLQDGRVQRRHAGLLLHPRATRPGAPGGRELPGPPRRPPHRFDRRCPLDGAGVRLRAGEGDVQALTRLAWIDYVVMLLYFAFVLGIGATLRRYVHTSEDFFLSGRSIPAWVTGLAFISANLGAQEVIGMGASGAKYGIATSY